MPEIPARTFVADMTSELRQFKSQLSHFILASPDAMNGYGQVMAGMRLKLAKGVCAWISLREGIGKQATEYREFETLALQVDIFTKFSLEAVRIQGCYLDGEMQSQALGVRLQMQLPFLVDLRTLMRKKTVMTRACTVWWNSAEGREELSLDRQ